MNLCFYLSHMQGRLWSVVWDLLLLITLLSVPVETKLLSTSLQELLVTYNKLQAKKVFSSWFRCKFLFSKSFSILFLFSTDWIFNVLINSFTLRLVLPALEFLMMILGVRNVFRWRLNWSWESYCSLVYFDVKNLLFLANTLITKFHTYVSKSFLLKVYC